MLGIEYENFAILVCLVYEMFFKPGSHMSTMIGETLSVTIPGKHPQRFHSIIVANIGCIRGPGFALLNWSGFSSSQIQHGY